MKRRIVLIIALLTALIVVFLVRYRRTSTNSHKAIVATESETSSEVQTNAASGDHRPSPLVVPVEAVRRLAAEQKWARKHNGPVAFYAKVVDQDSKPVAGVTLNGTLNIFDEGMFVSDKDRVHNTKLQILSDNGGCFDLKRDRGYTLRVESVEKEGYVWQAPLGLGSFDFAPMNRPKQPPDYKNPNRRFVFYIWKKRATEPVIRQGVRVRISSEREEHPINLLTGQLVERDAKPDLIIRTPHVADPSQASRGAREFIFEVPTGGILETEDVYPYAAPTEGYHAKWQWLFQPADTRPSAEGWKRNFYIKARDGRLYGSLSVVFAFGEPAFVIEVLANPAGSPNLEPDPDKLITDPEEIRRLDEQTRVK
jgi:hypothetical protein